MPRQALHAQTLGFVHPSTKKYLFFEAPMPQDFEAVLQKWRKYIGANATQNGEISD
jgi:23S rRNA pseudouridine1911/1915/1917 synthase